MTISEIFLGNYHSLASKVLSVTLNVYLDVILDYKYVSANDN